MTLSLPDTDDIWSYCDLGIHCAIYLSFIFLPRSDKNCSQVSQIVQIVCAGNFQTNMTQISRPEVERYV